MRNKIAFVEQGTITVHGAREHNLKGISVEIPRNRFVVITGVSGSGKSTLAFDILFAEGQRRFLDSMNAYARQFVEQLPRPDVDLIDGLPPTVSIEQRNSKGGGKSTVATVTEIHHFVRLLFARLGTIYCPDCDLPVGVVSAAEVATRIREKLRKCRELKLLAPVVRGRKGFHNRIAQWAARHGYEQIRADGRFLPADQPLRLDRFREHNVEIVTGVLVGGRGQKTGAGHAQSIERLVEETLGLGGGTMLTLDDDGQSDVYSSERTCVRCGRSFPPPDPKLFSYNSPAGWCPHCRGFGEVFYMPEGVDRGARAEAIEESWFDWMEGQRAVCPECNGARLNDVARAVRLECGGAELVISGQSGMSAVRTASPTIVDVGAASVESALEWVRGLRFTDWTGQIARDIVPEIRERLIFLEQVGLGYLQLGRSVPSLSGGEAQRIRLAAQLGSNLSGVLYVLDEPTIGLHARDNERLLGICARLVAKGNSLVVVEHDDATMRRADHIIDLGPGAGVNGGQVVASGSLRDLVKNPSSITGLCLREARRYPTRGFRRPVANAANGVGGLGDGAGRAFEWLVLEGASVHNLKNLTVRFPLGRLILVTGVSGSGKSSLVRECLMPALAAKLGAGHGVGTKQRALTGVITAGHEKIRAVHEVDQSPIGRTPRSVPATCVGFFDEIRRLFAGVPEARLRGYGPGRFSFNNSEGRCPECEGAGVVKLEMSFMPTAYVPCNTCRGLRFNPGTLEIEFHGHNIAQVLDMSVGQALEFFGAFPRIRRALEALRDTGLDYLKLGQTSSTLSGGEAQRVKLVTHLLTGFSDQTQIRDQKRKFNLFILEEPTIGLHMYDVKRLVEVLQRLVDAGHTVIVIEHNLDLIADADWVIDLGPEGGEAGGRIVAQGTPEQIARNKSSHTGRFLRKVLSGT